GGPENITVELSHAYAQYDDGGMINLTRSPLVVANGQVTLVLVKGNLSEAGVQTVSVSASPVSTVSRRETISNFNVSVPTSLSAAEFRGLLAESSGVDESNVTVTPNATTPGRLDVRFAGTYEFAVAVVSVGQHDETREAASVDFVSVEENVTAGESARVVVEVRDQYGNPMSGVRVRANTSATTWNATGNTTSDGQVTFEFDETTDVAPLGETATAAVNVTIDDRVSDAAVGSGPFDQTTALNATANVTVRSTTAAAAGSAGSWPLQWESPNSGGTDNTGFGFPGDCSGETCVVDAGNESVLNLTLNTSEETSGAVVSFSVNNSSVALLTVGNQTNVTNATGVARTQLSLQANGTVEVVAASGGGEETLQLDVTNLSTPGPTTVSGSGSGGGGGGGAYAVAWKAPSGTGVDCPKGAEGVCTINASKTNAVDLTAVTVPQVTGTTVSYAVGNGSVGSLTPGTESTGPGGTATTTFRPSANGTTTVYTTSGASGDALEVRVIKLFREQLGEIGFVSHEQSVAGEWETVTFSQSYQNPVVVTGGLTFNDSAPANVRIRDVTSTSFEFRIDEPSETERNGIDPSDDVHDEENFTYWVMEAGHHQIGGGVEVDVGTKSSVPGIDDASGAVEVSFTESFPTTPVVFSKTQTVNDVTPVATRRTGITASDFDVGLQQQEGDKAGHGDETVGYIAIEQQQGVNAGADFEVGKTAADVDGVETYGSASDPAVGRTISFSRSYSTTPVFIAQTQTINGADFSWLRYDDLSTSSADVAVDEGYSDSERSHGGTESVGYFVVGADLSSGDDLPVYENTSSVASPSGGLSPTTADGPVRGGGSDPSTPPPPSGQPPVARPAAPPR
ncbi:MAG: hypothetical protein ABEH80_08925, partial [Halobaculum sp.]